MRHKKFMILAGLLASIFILSTLTSAEDESPFLFKGFDFTSEAPSKEFINESFDDLFNIFGKDSTFTDLRKEETWFDYKGKYVRWQGIVTYKGIAVAEDERIRIGISHTLGTNVELIFDDDKKDIVKMVSRGDSIVYTGKLSIFFKRNLIFGLEDANVEIINGELVDVLKGNQKDDATLSSQPSHIKPAQIRSGKNISVESELKKSLEVKEDYAFDDLDRIFGEKSNLTYVQKEELWSNYKGKNIKWQGNVTYKGVGKNDWKRVGISHKLGTNVELIFDDDKKDIVKMVNKGDSITYTGKLSKLIGRKLLCSIVKVDIEKIGGKAIGEKGETVSKTSDTNIENKVVNETEIIMKESMAPKIIKEDDIKIIETPEGFVDISFEELDKIFGKENRMTESQKDKLWKEYKGKYVRWTGEVTNRGLGRTSGLRMGIKHKEGTDVELYFDIDKKDKVLQTKAGDTIIYTGKLVTRRGYILPYKLEDGKIEKIIASINKNSKHYYSSNMERYTGIITKTLMTLNFNNLI
ncbi:MAG: hypothetical protein ACE5KZ_06040 [Candidatus Scalinduaceae bacterium]